MPEHIERIFARINEIEHHLGTKLDKQTETISLLTAAMRSEQDLCKVCRPVVLGNGKSPISERMSLVESHVAEINADGPISERTTVVEKDVADIMASHTKLRWWIYGAIGSTALATLTAMLHWVPSLMGWGVK